MGISIFFRQLGMYGFGVSKEILKCRKGASNFLGMHGFVADIGVSKGNFKAPPLSDCKYGAKNKNKSTLAEKW